MYSGLTARLVNDRYFFSVHSIIDLTRQPKDKGEKRESKPRPLPKSKPHKNSSSNPALSEVNGKVSAAVPSHASRLIVRNMPFNATEQDLRAAFLPYGSIYSIQIPTDDKTSKKNGVPTTATANRKVRTKGFAFVWMSSKKDAEKAIKGCNGITLRAGTVEPTDEKKVATERVIAVDWALSKERWEAEKAKIEEAAMHESSESEDDDAEDDGSNSGEENSDDGDEGHLGLHSREEEDNSSNAGSEEDEENDEERVKPQLPQPEAGTTLFVRNIPFNATEDELRKL